MECCQPAAGPQATETVPSILKEDLAESHIQKKNQMESPTWMAYSGHQHQQCQLVLPFSVCWYCRGPLGLPVQPAAFSMTHGQFSGGAQQNKLSRVGDITGVEVSFWWMNVASYFMLIL